MIEKIKGLAGLVMEYVGLNSSKKIKTPELSRKVPRSYEDMGELLWLDLEQVTLYGHEDGNSEEKINSIMKGIDLGDVFPPVFVRIISEDKYRLYFHFDPFDNTNFGGHHRAIAHYRKKKPLKCVVVGVDTRSERARRDVKDLTVESRGEKYFQWLQKNYPRYR